MLKLNTSNQNKLREFQRMFGSFGKTLESTSVDLKEILGTPEEVVRNKATEAGEGVIIEDTRYVVPQCSFVLNLLHRF
jgi:inosine/xanthosine triphosphate pyrophosphatase family protein